MLNQLKALSWAQNTVYDYLLALLIFIGAIILLKLFQVFILSRLKKWAQKSKTEFDDIIIQIFTKIKLPFYIFVALFFGTKALIMPDIISKIISGLFLLVVVYEAIRAVGSIIDFFADRYLLLAKDGDEEVRHSQAMVRSLKLIVNLCLWVLAIILILSNLGINVTSLIASLGIGGIAIALAAQNILTDLFSSFSIYADKPFMVGDLIIVGDTTGTVEKIGLKTTRVRSVQGEEIVLPNKDLTASKIQNFKRMNKRRVVVSLGVIYGTDQKKLEQIPKIIEDIIKKVKLAEFDRCHFKSFEDSSLLFESVYYIDSPDYLYYMEANQKINLEIYKKFNKEKIDFAYPTQTVFVSKL